LANDISGGGNDNSSSIQRPTKARFAAAKRKYKEGAISKAGEKNLLDMGQTAA
jgi:hypothetical protein